MKWRLEFHRKESATKAGQAGRRFAIEVISRCPNDATTQAMLEARRQGHRVDLFNISLPKKL